jgi:gag-polyprotein putative aspartyl protease
MLSKSVAAITVAALMLTACGGHDPSSALRRADVHGHCPSGSSDPGDGWCYYTKCLSGITYAPGNDGRCVPIGPPAQTAGDGYSTAQGRTEVPISRGAGTATVPVTINGTLRLGFIIDSGASDVVIPADVVTTLLRTGTLRASDFLGKQTYVLADGSKLPSVRFRIRSLKVGDKALENVIGSASPVLGDPLLGQSFLSHFRSWSIDNQRMVLVLE